MSHRHVLKWSNIERVIYCSDDACDYAIDATKILNIVKESAAEQIAHQTGLTPRQKEEVRQMIQSALDTGSA